MPSAESLAANGFAVTCQRQDLLVALQAADAVVPSQSAKPILTNLLLDAHDDELEIVATDLQVGLRAVVRRLTVEQSGQVVVPARQLVSILKESRSPSVTIVLESDDERVQVSVELADGAYKVPAVVGETFPQVSTFPEEATLLRLPASDLERMIRKTAFAVDRERTSAVLSGVLLAATADEMLLAATDGKVLGECVYPGETGLGEEGLQAIVPATTISHVNRILGAGAQGSVDCAIAGKLVFIRAAIGSDGESAVQVELTSRLIDGSYPPYRNALPPPAESSVVFKTSEFASAVRRTALMTSSASRGIVLELGSSDAVLSNLFHATGSAQIPISCRYEGGPQRIGLNAAYLTDVLKVVQGDDIEIELHGPGKGLIIREEGSTFLVMPITLQG